MRHIELAQLSRSTFRRTGAATLGVFAVVGLVLVVHGHSVGQTPTTTDKVRLEGAGATFPALLYKKWIALYTAQNPQIVIDYKDVGSGEGVIHRRADRGSRGRRSSRACHRRHGGARL
jgi:ABC-type phosphate transport system substrate-binding protein